MQLLTTKKIISFGSFISVTLFIVALCGGFSSPENDSIAKSTIVESKVKQPKFPKKITFCDQDVPLQYFDVQESLDRELVVNNFWHSNTTFILKRSYRFFPIIDSILKANEIPSDFRYLAVIESTLQNVTSPSNAKGYWQFLEGTGKEYGLTINKQIDERLDIEKSTEAACRYLKKSYDRFNDWFLVAASYNMGMNGLARSLEDQKVDNYFDLRLNTETARYVYRILAAKTILENPLQYNFAIDTNYLYKPYKYTEVICDTTIPDLTTYALEHNTNIKMFKLLNPWLISDALTNSNRTEYILKLPNEQTRTNGFGK